MVGVTGVLEPWLAGLLTVCCQLYNRQPGLLPLARQNARLEPEGFRQKSRDGAKALPRDFGRSDRI